MRLIIVRHGESEADLLNVHEGRADFSLTKKGHAQAEALAAYLQATYKIDRIYASPLKRAYETAMHIQKKTDIPVIQEELLMEFNNGLIAGLTREEADEKYPYIPNLPVHKSVYEQESQLEFRNRAETVLSKIKTECAEEETILLVSHGGMINQLYHAFFKQPIQDDFLYPTGDTGLHEWLFQKGKAYLMKANYREHLMGIK